MLDSTKSDPIFVFWISESWSDKDVYTSSSLWSDRRQTKRVHNIHYHRTYKKRCCWTKKDVPEHSIFTKY